MKIELDDILNLQKPRKNLKEHEKGRLNPTANRLENIIGLNKTVPYIWAVDMYGYITVGIEKPWLYPQAFGYKEEDLVWQNIKKQLQLANEEWNYGHPTLTPLYDNKKNIISSKETELAFIGGELFYKDDKWILNNKSGRFRNVKDKKDELLALEQIVPILERVAKCFLEAKLVNEITLAPYSKNPSPMSSPTVPRELQAIELGLESFESAAQQNDKPSSVLFDNNDMNVAKEALDRIRKGIDQTALDVILFLSSKHQEKAFGGELKQLLDKYQSEYTKTSQIPTQTRS